MIDARTTNSRTNFLRIAALAIAVPLFLAGCTPPSERKPPPAHGESLEGMMRIAQSTEAAGDIGSAGRLYQRAHEKDPKAMEPLLSLGRVLRKAGAFAKSADTYRTALDLDASNTTALRGLGNALIALDQSNRALPRFNAAIMVDPNDALAYNGKGVALDMTGDHRSAQQAYYRGLELDRGNRILQNNLGLSLALSGNYADSIRVLEGVTTKGGATAQNRQNLALAYGLAGRNDDAEEMSRLDLRDDAVRNNLNYYNILRARAEKAKKTDSEPTAKP